MRSILKTCLLALFSCLLVGVTAKENKNLPFKPETAQNQVAFEENKGQIVDQNDNPRSDVLFGGSSENMRFFITKTGISYQLYRNLYSPDQKKSTEVYRTDVEWVNANRNPIVQTGTGLPDYNHYYGLPHSEKPALFVQKYESVRLKNIWNGVDIFFYSKDGHLESDWLLDHAESYKNIRFAVKGAKVSVDKSGNLVFETPFGTIQEGKLKAYQNDELVECTWIVDKNNVISLALKNYDTTLPLRIDPPVRVWGTYYGGNQYENGVSCSVDAIGDVYMAGTTYSSNNIATAGAHQSIVGIYSSAYLAKFTSSGVRLWGTYYSDETYATNCTVDAMGYSYMVGITMSIIGIATPGAHQTTNNGYYDSFIVKFNPLGVRQWGTYYGGLYKDEINSCKTDAAGNLYVAGTTCSPSFIATPGTHKPFYFTTTSYLTEGFVVKFTPSGVRVWGTYYGSNLGFDVVKDVDVNSLGTEIYITGYTDSDTDIATAGTHSTTFFGYDIFLAKLNGSGSRLWGTYHGVNNDADSACACIADLMGNVYVVGVTSANTGMATAGAHQITGNGLYGSCYSGIISKFNGSSGTMLWSTYYGGPGNTCIHDAFVDNMNNVHVVGVTFESTSGIIATPGSHQDTHYGMFDGFIAGFTSSGTRLYGTYYGGVESGYMGETISAISMDNTGTSFYIAGVTSSTNNISTPGSHQFVKDGNLDGFLAKFCIDANFITGKVFDDYNTNGIFDGTDVPITNFPVHSTVGGGTITNHTGDYEISALPSTTHTILPSIVIPHRTPVPASHSASFPATPIGLIDSGNDFAMATSPGIQDLVVTISSTPDVELGKFRVYVITYKNVGTATIPSGTIDFTHDNVMLLGTTIPFPISYLGSTLTWNYINLAPLESRTLKVTLFDPITDVIGRVANHTAVGNPIATDAVPANNTFNLSQTVVAPYDPNNKIVMPEGYLHPVTFISAGQHLNYIINFQNLGTAPAEVVKVVDTLSSNLQWGTFEMIGASHSYNVSMSPSGVVTWMFYGINLPHAAVNEPDSKGLIHYRIKPKSTLVIGDKIKNEAHIYFDYNPAIITNEVENEVNMTSTVAVNTPAHSNIKVYPNPNTGTFNLENASGLVQITNVLGAVVWQNAINTPLQNIDVKHLPKGVYVLHHKQDKIKLVIE